MADLTTSTAAAAAPVEPELESLSDWEGGKSVTDEVRRGSFFFAEPAVGTPAYDALVANRAHPVTYADKHVLRHVKRVKKKHLLGSHKKEKHRDRVNIKGKMIDGQHEQYILTMGMMMGIRVSVARALAASQLPLQVKDFSKVDKLVFPPGGSRRAGRMTPPHQLNHTFKFKDYSPRAFAAIREMYGVDSASYMKSVCGDFNFIQFIANSRSGQFFFYSHDGKYMIKTQTKEENKFLRRILPHYFRHMAHHPDSMVCQFYGMHRVKMYHLRRKLHFVVMRSVVDTACKIHTMYDLKGSLVGRQASKKDRETGGVLKDKDLVSDGVKFHLGERRGQLFCKVAAADAAFLAELKIMDYSLLVGIHDRSRRDEDEADWLARNAAGAMAEAADAAADADVAAADAADAARAARAAAGPAANNLLLPPPPPAGSQSAVVEFTKPPALFAQDMPQTPAAAARGAGGHGGAYFNARPAAPASPNSRPPLQRANSVPGSGALPAAAAAAERFSTGGGAGGGGGGAGAGAALPAGQGGPPKAHARPHSDTPRVRAKADRALLVKELPAEAAAASSGGRSQRRPSLPASPTAALAQLHVAAAGDGAAAEELDEWAATRRSTNVTTSEEEDSDEDSSDSEDEGEFAGEALSRGWTDGLFGKKRDGSGAGLPPKPLGDPEDVVLVPRHRKADDSAAAASMRESTREGSVLSPDAGGSELRLATRRDGGLGSRNPDGTKGDKVYFVGIIDILQQYTTVKRAETFVKSFTHDVAQISCVPPDQYAARFAHFIRDAVDLTPAVQDGGSAASSPAPGAVLKDKAVAGKGSVAAAAAAEGASKTEVLSEVKAEDTTNEPATQSPETFLAI